MTPTQLDTQKKLVESKNTELELVAKQNAGFRVTIERLDREKNMLNTKLRNAMRVTATGANKQNKPDVKKAGVNPSGDLDLPSELEVFIFFELRRFRTKLFQKLRFSRCLALKNRGA